MAWQNWTRKEKRQWREVVKPLVLERDGGLCRVSLSGSWKVVTGKGDDRKVEDRRCTRIATTVHHTKGSHTKLDTRYLVASCFNCNNRVGDPRKTKTPVAKQASWL